MQDRIHATCRKGQQMFESVADALDANEAVFEVALEFGVMNPVREAYQGIR